MPWLSMNRGIAHPILRAWSKGHGEQLKSYCFNRRGT